MQTATLVILGSARKESDTRSFMDRVMQDFPFHLADLLDYRIHPYSYEGDYPENDDLDQIIELILHHQHLVFATPVYWYAMSGSMKILFDRFTDLITFRKNAGRKLKGKSVSLLAVGADEELPPGFSTPFQRTAKYLDMHFNNSLYHSTKFPTPDQLLNENILNFRRTLYMNR